MHFYRPAAAAASIAFPAPFAMLCYERLLYLNVFIKGISEEIEIFHGQKKAK